MGTYVGKLHLSVRRAESWINQVTEIRPFGLMTMQPMIALAPVYSRNAPRNL